MRFQIKITVALWLLFAAPAFADCIKTRVIGTGRADPPYNDPWRPEIPDAIARIPDLAWTAHIPPKTPSKADGPKYPDAYMCFRDSLKLPPGVAKMTRTQASAEVLKREPGLDIAYFRVPEPQPRLLAWLGKVRRIASRYLGVAVAWASSSTENFDRADNADLGTTWDVYNSAACQIVSNAVNSSAFGTRCSEGYNAYVPGGGVGKGDQYVQAVFPTNYASGSEPTDAGLLIRLQAPATYSGYMCRAQYGEGTTTIFQRRDAGSGTNLATESLTTWASGDSIRCEAISTGLAIYRNGSGVALLSTTDGTYGTGRGGVFLLNTLNSVGTPNGFVLDDFEVGDLGTTSSRRPIGVVIFP